MAIIEQSNKSRQKSNIFKSFVAPFRSYPIRPTTEHQLAASSNGVDKGLSK